jgi:hypothetical protein
MNDPLTLSVAQYPILAPTFTLASALWWRGHHCAQRCSSSLDDLPAAMWFLRRRNPSRPGATTVVVDLTDSGETVARTRRLIRDINICTRGDSIYVLGRRVADIGNALSLVTRGAAPLVIVESGRPHGQDPGGWPSGGAAERGWSRTPTADTADLVAAPPLRLEA